MVLCGWQDVNIQEQGHSIHQQVHFFYHHHWWQALEDYLPQADHHAHW